MVSLRKWDVPPLTLPDARRAGKRRSATTVTAAGYDPATMTPLMPVLHPEPIATYPSYQEAQTAVDKLSDSDFPVQNVQIVGLDLRSVEQVTGRLTTGRAALAGAASGAWFGLFIGLLVGLFTRGPEWIGLMIGGLLIGALWGAVLGFVAHWATRGQRDFSSLRTTVADRYEVRVAHDHTLRARQVLGLTD